MFKQEIGILFIFLGLAINGGAANSLCQDAPTPKRDTTENERSVGFLLTYGKFKFLDLGDLTRDIEMAGVTMSAGSVVSTPSAIEPCQQR